VDTGKTGLPISIDVFHIGKRSESTSLNIEETALDKTFFRIVRGFGLLIAFLALIVTVGALAWGLVLYQAKVTEAKMPPSIDYGKYNPSLGSSPTTGSETGIGDEATLASLEAPRTTVGKGQFPVHLWRIVTNSNRYVSLDPTMREEPSRSRYTVITDSFPVQQRAGIFADDPSNRANLANSAEKVKLTELQTQVSTENERIQKETIQAAAKKVEALQLFGAAIVAFVIFVLFTLMLVLNAMERNIPVIILKVSTGHPTASLAAV
jgi:hypothetical protein